MSYSPCESESVRYEKFPNRNNSIEADNNKCPIHSTRRSTDGLSSQNTGLSSQSSLRSFRRHCHESSMPTSIDKKARRQLVIASILCLFFMIGEIVGGALAHSLAIMTDAAHLLTDFASFLISLLALYIGSRPSTKKMSFGWYRAEVVGALTSVLLIWLVTGILVYLAIMRVIEDNFEIDSKIMLITSSIGVGVNVIMLFTLQDHGHGHGHSHGNSHENSNGHEGVSAGHTHQNVLPNHQHHENVKGEPHKDKPRCPPPVSSNTNLEDESFMEFEREVVNERVNREIGRQNITVRAAWIHVLGDLVQSVGVMIAAMIIYFKPALKIVDPICTFLFSVLVLFTTINIIRDTLYVLMEAAPRSLDFNEVKSALNDIAGVVEVHNLRMWSLTLNKAAVSCHLALDPEANSRYVLHRAHHLLRKRYLVHEVTIQLEQYIPEMSQCLKCQEPRR